MDEPEVTREEAERDAVVPSAVGIDRYARTVVALYAERDEWLTAAFQGETRTIAMRECMDRLRDGWEPGEFTERQGIPFGWCWHKATYDGDRITFYERHQMTPAQQAVMTRG